MFFSFSYVVIEIEVNALAMELPIYGLVWEVF